MVNKNRSGKGWSVTQVAEALMIDRETVRKHYKRYRQGGIASAYRSTRRAVSSPC
jgi:DNA-binding transcriptional ArsR family regulator